LRRGQRRTVIVDGIRAQANGKLTIADDVLRKRTEELKESGARIMREGNYRVETAPELMETIAMTGKITAPFGHRGPVRP